MRGETCPGIVGRKDREQHCLSILGGLYLTIRNSILSSNNPLLEKIVRADLLLGNRSDTWTYQVLNALQDLPTSQQLLDAIRSRQTINLGQFELTLREHTYHWGLERSWHFDTT